VRTGLCPSPPPLQQTVRPLDGQDGSDRTSMTQPLARWLGTHAGVTPTGLEILEPYAIVVNRTCTTVTRPRLPQNRVQSKRGLEDPNGLYGGTRYHTPPQESPDLSTQKLKSGWQTDIVGNRTWCCLPCLKAIWSWMRTHSGAMAPLPPTSAPMDVTKPLSPSTAGDVAYGQV